MKTQWDYTALADAYLQRPDYASPAIEAMIAIARVQKNDPVCDIGAGVAHLTLMLADHELEVVAVEPNDAMRANGIIRTEAHKNVVWHEGTGEQTGQKSNHFSLVTFGSSFNVCDRNLALQESARILAPKAWFACLWNHRNLDDPIQGRIEEIIKKHVPAYNYGTRREDQRQIIEKSSLFREVIHIDTTVEHTQSVMDCIAAWRSHATLARQAQEKMDIVISDIEKELIQNHGENGSICIPYTTNIWMAQMR